MTPRLSPHALTLAEVAREVPLKASLTVPEGKGSLAVSGVQHDSRLVEPGDLFVVRRGARADGATYVRQAEARGAVALVAAEGVAVDSTLPVLRTTDLATVLAYAAAAVYGHPSYSLDVVGITGTNGKTSTAHLTRAIVDFHAGGPRCGVLGTVGHQLGDLVMEAAHTTPEADEVARLLALLKAKGATHAAMEVSSIALAAGRVRAVRFRVAAFTNLTQDHLDYHGSMGAYAAAKRALFTEHAPGSAVINVDDAFGERLAAEVMCPVVRVSTRSRSVEAGLFSTRAATFGPRGLDATISTPAGDIRVRAGLIGRHNLENVIVALGIADALGIPLERAEHALRHAPGVPGRLERCDGPQDDVVVFVDYAHTPDALAHVLDAVRSVCDGKVACIFGCGGDRDSSKRGPMGIAAALGSQFIVITNDNPRSEDPGGIARAIEAGVARAGATLSRFPGRGGELSPGYVVELDRQEAITRTIAAASPGDVIVIAGKGHETYQVVGDETRSFDDREVAKQALLQRRPR